MKTAVIAGATGLTGQYLFNMLSEDDRYSSIILLGRNSPGQLNEKSTFIKTSFEDIDQVKLSNPVDELFCCLGTTIKKAGSQEAFRTVDFDAVVELGKWAAQYPTCRFVVISSVGANPASSNFYLRTKGQMENTLKQLKLHSLIILRPSLLMGHRKEFRLGERIAQIIMPAIAFLFIGKLKKYRPVKASLVAKVMIELAQSKFGDTYIIESDEINKFQLENDSSKK